MSDAKPLAILIAEADQLVRMVTADMLTDFGCQAIVVGTVAEALAVLQGPTAVRMLITGRGIVGDGVALAHIVHQSWPDIGIIVTSGAGVDLQPDLPPGTRLLSKPYAFADLIQEVEAGLVQVHKELSPAPMLLSGVPPNRGVDLGNGMGGTATPSTEPDKT
ncbi:response regulator [Methylobacterium sp. CM6246]